MNHIYRVIFNRHTNTHQAVSEIAKGCGKTNTNKSSAIKRLLLSPLALAMALLSMVSHAAPTGGQVVAGTANIHQAGNITDIHQASQNAAINWQDFSINAQETVNFHQPSSQAVTLNRVLGHEKSVIDGMMNANGKVFIQNPNGTLIGKNAQINVGGLVATTAKISDEDFMQGNYRFVGGTGEISNLGQITVPKGGVVALIAPIVKNSGTITAHGADSLLASADSFSITLPDNTNFAYTLDKGTLQGLVDNGGAILADGGRVVLTTKGIDTVKKSLIKHSGIIEANTVRNNNGVIELLGDLDNSKLQLTGTLKAEGQGTDNGGFIETSAAKFDIADTAHVSTQSKQGKTGTWLIDPKDFTVAPSGGDTTGAKVSQGLQNNNVQLKSKDGAIEGKGDVIINDTISWDKNKLTLTADNDIHINKTLNGTGTAKLALEYGQGTADGGDSDYYLDKGTPLKDRTVKVNLPVGKNLSTKKGQSGAVEVYDVIHEMPKIVKGSDGEWESQFTTDKIAFGRDMDVSHTKNYEGFAGWGLPNNSAKIHGLGHVVDKLWLRSKKNGQYTGLFQKKYGGVLRDIGVTNVDIQSQGNYAYAGGLVGYGYNIHNSYAAGTVSTTGNYAYAGGLVGYGYNIHNSYAAGTVSTTGEYANTGGLVGYGYNIHNSYAAGTVSTSGSSAYAGGLVGKGNTIHNSYATGTVSTAGDDADAGGLAGYGSGIHNSYAAGTVSTSGSSANTGGLVGYGYNIHNSYAAGTVSTSGSSANTGGLVGVGYDIHHSYATGNVSTTGEYAHAGGLVGYGGYINNSYADNQVSATDRNSLQGGVIGAYSFSFLYHSPSKNTFFNQTKNPALQAVGKYSSWVDQSQITNLTGKTEAELKQKATFKDWDFDKVWRISEGSDTPRLRALTQGMIIINPKTNLGIQAHNLKKTYDGKAVNTEEDLRAIAKANGFKDIAEITGLKDNDKLTDDSIFSGKLRYDGTWKGAKDVKQGGYTIVPTGLSGGQKYEIKYGEGSLTIDPKAVALFGQKEYNGNRLVNEANSKINIIGVETGDVVKLSGFGFLVDKNASANAADFKKLSSSQFKLGNDNYTIDMDKSKWSVARKPINVTIYGEKIYDGNSEVSSKDIKSIKGFLESDTQAAKDSIFGGLFLSGYEVLDSGKSYKNKLLKSEFIFNNDIENNYDIKSLNSEWVIKPRPIFLIGDRYYDGTNIARSSDISLVAQSKYDGVLDKDLNDVTLTGEGRLASKDASKDPIAIQSHNFKLSGSKAYNYYLDDKNTMVNGGFWHINPKPLNIYVLNNFFNTLGPVIIPDSAIISSSYHNLNENLGFAVNGLANEEKISPNIELLFKNPKYKNGIIQSLEIHPDISSIKFLNGKSSNYDIIVNHGYLTILPDSMKLKNFPISDDDFIKNKEISYIADKLEEYQDELLASDIVYDNDDNDEFGKNRILREGHKLQFLDSGKSAALDLQMALYKKDNDKYIIAYRGSQELMDWVSDIATIFATYGQYTEAAAITKKWIANIRDKSPNAEIILTGHSLGGGLAQYAAATIDDKNLKAVTFNPAPIRLQMYQDILKTSQCGKYLCNNNKAINFRFDNEMLISVNPHLANLGIFGDHKNIHHHGLIGESLYTKFLTEGVFADHTRDHMYTVNEILTRVNENKKFIHNPNINTIKKSKFDHVKNTDGVVSYITDEYLKLLLSGMTTVADSSGVVSDLAIKAGKDVVVPIVKTAVIDLPTKAGEFVDKTNKEVVVPIVKTAVIDLPTKAGEFVVKTDKWFARKLYDAFNITESDFKKSMIEYDVLYKNAKKEDLPWLLDVRVRTENYDDNLNNYRLHHIMKSIYIANYLGFYDINQTRDLFDITKSKYISSMKKEWKKSYSNNPFFANNIKNQISVLDKLTFDFWLKKQGNIKVDMYGSIVE